MTIPIAQIVNINAPASAAPGDIVTVDVSVMNNSTQDMYFSITGVFDSTNLNWQLDYLLVSAGQTVIFHGTFTMPNSSVRLTIWSWYWDAAMGWVLDMTNYVDIALTALVSTISEFSISDYVKA